MYTQKEILIIVFIHFTYISKNESNRVFRNVLYHLLWFLMLTYLAPNMSLLSNTIFFLSTLNEIHEGKCQIAKGFAIFRLLFFSWVKPQTLFTIYLQYLLLSKSINRNKMLYCGIWCCEKLHNLSSDFATHQLC